MLQWIALMLAFDLNLLPGESIPCDCCKDHLAEKLIVDDKRIFACRACWLERLGMNYEVEECGD